MTAFERAWRILKMGQHSSHQIARYPIENKDDALVGKFALWVSLR